jgi:L-alanine-DL-glutamate epimerase-like enolase superfamily enzyme
MKVTAVSVETLELAYERPFVIASSALAAGPCALASVETDEGLTGYGEACPAYEFTEDTLWTVGNQAARGAIDGEAVAAQRVERPWHSHEQPAPRARQEG